MQNEYVHVDEIVEELPNPYVPTGIPGFHPVFQVRYEPMENRPDRIDGFIYFPTLGLPTRWEETPRIHFRSSERARPGILHNLLIDSDDVEEGFFNPVQGLITLFWRYSPGEQHFLCVSGAICRTTPEARFWLKEGF